MKRIAHIYFACIVLTCLAACQKEVNWSFPNADPNDPDAISPVTTNVTGLVLDQNGNPFRGVTVKASGKSVRTNNMGHFTFEDIRLDKYSSLITAEINGYFKSYRVFTASANGMNFVKIQLLKKTVSGTVSSTSGGIVTTNGYSVSLPANAVVSKSTNAVYNGNINVFIHPVDPTSTNISDIIPGSLLGIDTANRRIALESFGMVAVELESTGGEPLQIATGKTALLSFAIPATLIPQSPDRIPLWYVDDASGVWKQEGEAIKTGNVYTGDVKHFSFWNCDRGLTNLAFLELRIKNFKGGGIPFVKVSITRNVSGETLTTAYGYTDSRGWVGGLVPMNEPLTLKIINECGVVVYTQSIAPITVNTNLGDIMANLGVHGILIAGKIKNCSGQAVTDGWTEVFFEGKYYYVSVDQTGAFNLSVLNCYNGTVTIAPKDAGGQQQGAVTTYTPGIDPLDNLTLTACGIPLTGYQVTTLAGDGTFGFVDGAGVAARFNHPSGVVFDGAGNIFIADAGNHAIRKIDPLGIVTTFAGTGTPGYVDGIGTAAQFFVPSGLAIDAMNNLYVADKKNQRIRKISPAGVVTTIAGDGSAGFLNGPVSVARFNEPIGITVDPAGDIYISDSKNYRIRKISVGTGTVSTFAGTGTSGYVDGNAMAAKFDHLGGLTFDPANNLYVVDSGNDRIRKITPSGTVTTFAGNGVGIFSEGPLLSASFDAPADIAYDPNTGDFLIMDGNYCRVRRISNGEVSTIAGSTNGYLDGPAATAKFSLPQALAIDASGTIIIVCDWNNLRIRKIRKL